MENKFIRQLALLIFCAINLISCNSSECGNTNPIFKNNSPESKIYKDELARVLRNEDLSKVLYFVNGYSEKQDHRYMFVRVKSKDICAILVLDLNKYGEELEQFVKVKGMSYGDAEIRNLKFKIVQNQNSTNFIYENLNGFID
jgi:hypothetical protein